jgi:hypothetical protein
MTVCREYGHRDGPMCQCEALIQVRAADTGAAG